MSEFPADEAQAVTAVVYAECDRYGLPHSASALLRHIYNNRDATFGLKDLSISFLQDKVAQAESALQLIAAEKRPDGTYNRSREACEQLARETLEKMAKPSTR